MSVISTRTMTPAAPIRNLRTPSGPQLLMLAILGDAALARRIDDELDRRASGIQGPRPRNPRPRKFRQHEPAYRAA